MQIKKNTVIPTGFKITKCVPGRFNGPSNWELAQREERALASGESASRSDENRAERRAEIFGAALAGGLCADDALAELDGE